MDIYWSVTRHLLEGAGDPWTFAGGHNMSLESMQLYSSSQDITWKVLEPPRHPVEATQHHWTSTGVYSRSLDITWRMLEIPGHSLEAT
jgi:hypothetical protein